MTRQEKLLISAIVFLIFACVLMARQVFASNVAAFNVPANTPAETIYDDFTEVFPGITLPEGGIMPGSTIKAGRHIVIGLFPQSCTEIDNLLTSSGKNWQVWGCGSSQNAPAYCSNEQYTNQEDCEGATETWYPPAQVVHIPFNNSIKNFFEPRYLRDEDGNIIGEQTVQGSWAASFPVPNRAIYIYE